MTWAQYYLWGMHMFWWFFWMVGIGLLLYFTWPGRQEARRDLSREALRRRFADGDISEDEYRRRLAVLKSTDVHGGDQIAEEFVEDFSTERFEEPPPPDAAVMDELRNRRSRPRPSEPATRP